MIKVAIYTSNHGFGHATRMAALAEEFIRYGLLCHVRSNRPEFIFGNLNPHYHSLSDAGIDFGVRHNHNLVPEKELTRQDLLDLMDRRPELVAQEVRFLKEQEIDFVVADIPFLIMEACSYAKIPVFAISNFDWYFIYSELFKDDRDLLPLVNCIGQLYKHTNLAIRLPLSSRKSMASFPRIINQGLLARKKDSYGDIRQQYGLKEDLPLIVCMFGGEGVPEFSLDKLCKAYPGYVFSIQEAVAAENHIRVNRDADFLDLIRPADIVITKPGYSTFAEALQFNKTILYHERENYPEERVLVQGLVRHPYAYSLPKINLSIAEWKRKLKTVKIADPREKPRVKNCNTLIAQTIITQFIKDKYNTQKISSIFDLGTNNYTWLLMNGNRMIHKYSGETGLGIGFKAGKVTNASINRAKKKLKPLLVLNSRLVSNSHVLATAIFRKATNLGVFGKWVSKNQPSSFQVLSAEQELKYNFQAIRLSFQELSDFLAFDIGGGSTEFISFKDNHYHGKSVGLGLRLLKETCNTHQERLGLFQKELDKVRFKAQGKLIGIGLTASYLSLVVKRIKHYIPSLVHKSCISKIELEELKETIWSKDDDQNSHKTLLGYLMEPHNLEILALSVDFILLILDKFAASEFVVCDYGIAYGYTASWKDLKH